MVCMLGLAMSGMAAEKPNIVFILADDMGFDSVSANNPEIGPMKTPHIDRLISQGMNFTDAHSGSAVCSPTRYGLLTGRYCWRTRLKSEVLGDSWRQLVVVHIDQCLSRIDLRCHRRNRPFSESGDPIPRLKTCNRKTAVVLNDQLGEKHP